MRSHACRLVAAPWIAAALWACSGDSHEVGDDEPAAVDGGIAGDAGRDGAAGDETCEAACGAELVPSDEDCVCAGVHMRLLPLREGFYAQPWPLATRMRSDGALDLEGFPMPEAATFLADNLETIARESRGFSTNGAIFASFDGTLDPDSLPTPEQSVEDDSSIQLIEVGADSETRGERTPIACSFTARATGYTPPNMLACTPYPGFSLRPAATYALVLYDRLHDPRDRPVRRSRRMHEVLEGEGGADPLTGELSDAYAPLVDYLLAEGDGLDHVVGGTVFRTQDPVAQMRALAEDVHDQDPPAPDYIAAANVELPEEESGNYTALEGTYDTPIYQQGITPYFLFGGDIQFTADGKPKRASTFPIRFAMTIPEGEMPEEGWPVVLYHHGTGGDAYTYITDGTAYHLAAAGVAAISIDAPAHGTRSGGLDPQLTFFNIANVLAMRDNIRQGAVDLLVLERFVQAFDVAAEDSPTDAAIRFDAERIFAMGHSQGALLLPLMLPFSERVKGVMLSGAGASITASVLYKHAPVDIPALARMYLALEDGERLDPFHPALSLLQAFSEVCDGVNYAPYAHRWPGGRGIDVWATQGLRDTFAPPEVTNALVTAYGLSPIGPLAMRVEGLLLRGLTPLTPPVSANREAIDGERYTAVYSQYAASDHFLHPAESGRRSAARRTGSRAWRRAAAPSSTGEDLSRLPAGSSRRFIVTAWVTTPRMNGRPRHR